MTCRKDENKQKEAGIGPFLKTKYSHLCNRSSPESFEGANLCPITRSCKTFMFHILNNPTYRAVGVAQLAEQLLPIPEAHRSNPVIGKII